MKESMYLNSEEAIINFDKAYPASMAELVGSKDFTKFLTKYINYLKVRDPELYTWIMMDKTMEEATHALSIVYRELLILQPHEINAYYIQYKERLLYFTERLYDYWKSHQRYSVTRQRFSGKSATPFVTYDSQFNTMLRSTFRQVEQTLQGRKNGVFRQVQAGTNAAISTYLPRKFPLGEKYEKLKNIEVIESVMLRTPMITHLNSNKRTGMFSETTTNPIEYASVNKDEWYCYPAKAGSLLVNVYFHRDFMNSGVSLANLFELATPDEVENAKPGAVVFFGNQDEVDDTNFYYDNDLDLWIGCISYSEKIQYFGYMKKMILTLHNLAKMKQGWLPIHGAFINVTLYSGKKKGIMLMGDSGAGKSESIEALKSLGNEEIKDIEVVFDDMGTIHLEEGVPYGQGTEIGAFIRLDDLDPGTPYRDMDRSIFFNPDSLNARVITPAAPYSIVASNHKIDLFCYANNYDTALGIHEFKSVEDAKPVFTEGKRMAKGTTQEVGISTTYFANPFGPMQKQEICEPILNKVFDALKDNGVFIGEIYTHLGLDKQNRDGINVAAKELLEFIKKD